MAIPSGAVWEVRTTGSDQNGGFFNASRGGTDYSQQDSPQLVLTGGACSGNTTVTSATGGFTTQDRERLNGIFTRVQSVTAGQITVISPFGSGTTINLVAGDSYSLSWSRSGWPDLTNATITLILQSGSQRFTVSCSASETTVTANIPASLTRQLRGKTWEYSVRVTKDDGFERTPVSGLVVVKTVPL